MKWIIGFLITLISEVTVYITIKLLRNGFDFLACIMIVVAILIILEMYYKIKTDR